MWDCGGGLGRRLDNAYRRWEFFSESSIDIVSGKVWPTSRYMHLLLNLSFKNMSMLIEPVMVPNRYRNQHIVTADNPSQG